ncbi:MAG: hypothetical protein ABW328_22360 [Ilumatobacteraceae bacterium]
MTAPELRPDATAVAMAVGEPLGSRILDGAAVVAPVAVPGLADIAVWSVTDEHGDHPMRLYVGVWPDGAVRTLSADQEAWAELVAVVGVHLSGPEEARAYVEAFLEVTRGAMVLVRPVTSLAELSWRPGSTDEEAAKESLLADPPDVAPAVQVTPSGFRVELTLVVDQRLQRNLFDVTPEGTITSSYRVLVDELPLPIVR